MRGQWQWRINYTGDDRHYRPGGSPEKGLTGSREPLPTSSRSNWPTRGVPQWADAAESQAEDNRQLVFYVRIASCLTRLQ